MSRINGVLRCDGREECAEPVTHIGEKGYAYCAKDVSRRHGVERTRKLLVREREQLARGERLESFDKPCSDHWHCDPKLAAHACDKPDRTKPCPTCKEPQNSPCPRCGKPVTVLRGGASSKWLYEVCCESCDVAYTGGDSKEHAEVKARDLKEHSK